MYLLLCLVLPLIVVDDSSSSFLLSHTWAYQFCVLARPFFIFMDEVVFPCLSRWDESTIGSSESHDMSVYRACLDELSWDMVSPFSLLILSDSSFFVFD